MRIPIATGDAPSAIGPYSQAIRLGEVLYCSGQLGLLSTTGALVGPGTREQTDQCLRNLDAVCRQAGTALSQAVLCTIYLVELSEFALVNEVYQGFFSPPYPARATVQVVALPRQARVEISAIVAI